MRTKFVGDKESKAPLVPDLNAQDVNILCEDQSPKPIITANRNQEQAVF